MLRNPDPSKTRIHFLFIQENIFVFQQKSEALCFLQLLELAIPIYQCCFYILVHFSSSAHIQLCRFCLTQPTIMSRRNPSNEQLIQENILQAEGMRTKNNPPHTFFTATYNSISWLVITGNKGNSIKWAAGATLVIILVER